MLLTNTESSEDVTATSYTLNELIEDQTYTETIPLLEEVSAPTDSTLDTETTKNEIMREESYFDSTMQPTHTAYLGKTATLSCVVHDAKSDRSVSIIIINLKINYIISILFVLLNALT